MKICARESVNRGIPRNEWTENTEATLRYMTAVTAWFMWHFSASDPGRACCSRINVCAGDERVEPGIMRISWDLNVCVFFSIVNFFILRNWTCALIPWYLVPAAKWIHYFLPKNREYFFIPNIWYQRPAKQAKSRAPLHSVSMDCAGGERSIDFPCELMENMVFQWRLDAKTHKHKQKISKITKVWEVDELQFNTSSIPGKLTRLGLGVPDHWELWVYINKYIYTHIMEIHSC